MRWLCLSALVLAITGAAQAQGIVDVLRQSQQRRLEAMPLAPQGERSQQIHASFDALRPFMPADMDVELRVIRGPIIAETLQGHIVVANEALAELPEDERRFVLAHELGHVVAHHWAQLGQVYTRWVPGAVTAEQTDAVAGSLGREASALSHQQEFEADAFALQMLRRLGRPPAVAFSAFMHLGTQQDTATHPGTRKRVASLRAAAMAAEDSGGNDPE